MKNNQIRLLDYFKVDFRELKIKGDKVNLIQEEISNDERGVLKRSVYEWNLREPVLVFSKAEQIEFNDVPTSITFRSEKSTFGEIEKIVSELVELLGPDINDKRCLARLETTLLDDYHSRMWSFNKEHKKLKGKYPPEGEGYLITLERNKDISELQILGYMNLFK